MLLRRAALTLALLTAPALTAVRAAPEVFVAYPPNGHRVAFDHVLLEGSVPPGANLKIGGEAAAVGPDGLFVLWWPLRVGVNDLRLVTTLNGQTGGRTLRVTRTVAAPLPAVPTTLDRASLRPAVTHEFWDPAGDTPDERSVRVAFQGAPGGRAAFRVADGPPTPMREVSAGQYEATYVLPPTPTFRAAAVTVTLTGRDGRSVSAPAPGLVLAPGGGLRGGSQRPGTVPGLGLNDAANMSTTLTGEPFLFPRDGMTFRLAGRVGDDLRARLAPGVSALITAAQLDLTSLDLTPAEPAPALGGTVTLNGSLAAPTLPALPALAALPLLPPLPTFAPTDVPVDDLGIRVGLNGARVPFTLAQDQGGRRLTLTLYGLETPPTLPAPLADPLIARAEVQAVGLGVTRLTLDLAAPQAWGFSAKYDGGDLLLAVRRPPALDPAQPLAGRVIVLDAGHGGTQHGGAGSLRVPEKALMLPLTLRAAELLRARGAGVVLTREADVTLGLYERGLSAEAARADLLVSIHANALPDGRDPRGIRGPEVYFSHPQAEAPAAALLAALRRSLPDLGPGAGLRPGANLALTRPTTQPSLLIETGYLTDPGNLRLLMDPAGRERLAQAIAAGIAEFYAAQVDVR
jgi:N-acetylmuramoyl-L-alanine amidase